MLLTRLRSQNQEEKKENYRTYFLRTAVLVAPRMIYRSPTIIHLSGWLSNLKWAFIC